MPSVKKQIAKTQSDLRVSLRKEMGKDQTEKHVRLPRNGMDEEALVALMEKRSELDVKNWSDGKITGAVYHGGARHMKLMGKIMGMFGYTNPLHPALHPATRQMDAECVRMVCNMYNGSPETSCGAFTTGGTESILCALKAYRDWAKATKGVKEPNIVACVTAHAAFDKGCHYFGIEMRHARADPETQRVDTKHLESLIDGNTIAIVGSACQFPHGSIDPIETLSSIAIRHRVGLHVDCCLGGFIVPFMEKAGYKPFQRFDFRVPGVTTISCDPHKYGFAPKGASILMFRDHELRHYMYTFVTKWTVRVPHSPSHLDLLRRRRPVLIDTPRPTSYTGWHLRDSHHHWIESGSSSGVVLERADAIRRERIRREHASNCGGDKKNRRRDRKDGRRARRGFPGRLCRCVCRHERLRHQHLLRWRCHEKAKQVGARDVTKSALHSSRTDLTDGAKRGQIFERSATRR